MGMWELKMKGGRCKVGLTYMEDQGFLDAELLWIGGSVVPRVQRLPS